MNEESVDNVMKQALAYMKKKKIGKGYSEYDRKDCPSEEIICDYLSFNLSVEERDEVEGHLARCPFCRKLVISEVSSGQWTERISIFEKIIQKIGKIIKTIAQPVKIPLAWIEDRLKLSIVKISFEVLAVASVLIFAVVIYRAVTPKKVKKISTGLVDNQYSPFRGTFKVNEVKNPIIIKTENIKNTFERLKVNIQSLNGKLVLEESKLFDEEARVVFKIDKDKEEEFFNELGQLGEVDKQEEGYKDKEGNILIYIFLK